jgi:hypothetical protein
MYTVQLDLLNEDGQPIILPTPMGHRPMQITSQFEVGSPRGLIPGTDLDVALAMNIAPLPLEPGRRYVWRCSINDAFEEGWQVSF